jgi:hypothetical protein
MHIITCNWIKYYIDITNCCLYTHTAAYIYIYILAFIAFPRPLIIMLFSLCAPKVFCRRRLCPQLVHSNSIEFCLSFSPPFFLFDSLARSINSSSPSAYIALEYPIARDAHPESSSRESLSIPLLSVCPVCPAVYSVCI